MRPSLWGLLLSLALTGSASAADVEPLLQFEFYQPQHPEPSTFRLRRCRMVIKEDLGKKRDLLLEVRARPDGLSLLDAYVESRLLGDVSVRVGQFKRPFSRGSLISSKALHTSDRDLVNDLFGDNDRRLAGAKGDNAYLGRDLGIALRWKWKGTSQRVDLELDLSNGNGNANQDIDAAKQLSSRVSYSTPFQGLELGAGLSWADASVGRSGSAWGVDAAWRWRWFELWAEWLAGKNRVTGADMVGSTVEGQAIWRRFAGGVRVSRVDPDRDLLYDAAWEWTPFVTLTLWRDSLLLAELSHFDPAQAPGAAGDSKATQWVLAWRVWS